MDGRTDRSPISGSDQPARRTAPSGRDGGQSTRTEREARERLSETRREWQRSLRDVEVLRSETAGSAGVLLQLRADLNHVHAVLNAERAATRAEKARLQAEKAQFAEAAWTMRAAVTGALAVLARTIPGGSIAPTAPSPEEDRAASIDALLDLSDADFLREVRIGIADGRFLVPAGEGGADRLIGDIARSEYRVPKPGRHLDARNTLLEAAEAAAILHLALEPDWLPPIEPPVVHLTGVAATSGTATTLYEELGSALALQAMDAPAGAEHEIGAFVAVSATPETLGDPTALLVGLDCPDGSFRSDEAGQLDAGFSGIACLTEHARTALVDTGIAVPVAAIGFGVDHRERSRAEGSPADETAPRPSAPKLAGSRAFRFVHVATRDLADGTDLTITSYGRTFRRSDDVSLVLAVAPAAEASVRWILQDRAGHDPEFPHVEIVELPASADEQQALLELCHVAVAPSRAGHFSKPVMLAVMAGLPVVATGRGGHLDCCDERNAWLVDYYFEPSSGSAAGGAPWARARDEALDEALRRAAACTREERAERGRVGRQRLLTSSTWDDVARRTQTLGAHAIDARRMKRTRVGWISTWNIKCGIAGAVQQTLATLPKDEVVVFAPFEPNPLRPDEPFCRRTWVMAGSNTFDTLIAEIRAADIKAVIIHFNFGFYNHEQLGWLIVQLKERGLVVMIDLHSTIDPGVPDPNFTLSSLLPGLRRCDRIFAHSIADMNRLKALGLADNVMLFPLGVRGGSRAERQRIGTRGRPRLASFGFCLPGKGLPELVDAIAILRDRGRDVALHMLNAEYDRQISADEIEALRNRITRLRLDGHIHLQTDYLDDDECLRLLGEADLIVNPYQATRESASASIRFSLASGAPVTVTPLPIFDDLGGAVFRMPGTDPGSIARGIEQALDHLTDGTPEATAVQSSASRWLDEHDFARQGPRLMRLAHALRRDQVWALADEEDAGGR